VRFLLLKDFFASYSDFEFRGDGINDDIETEVLRPMRSALSGSVSKLIERDLEDMHTSTRLAAKSNEFIVSMDGGVCFPHADARLDVTRTAFELAHVISGPYIRRSRHGEPAFAEQGLRLRRRYEAEGHHRPITLCDDGISTGRSLEHVLGFLSDLELEVRRIVVLANPNQINSVRGVPITTLYPDLDDFEWLNERDLFWGLPRSGVSIAPRHGTVPTCGVPYTFDPLIAASSIGLGDDAADFCNSARELNIRLWEILDEHHGRPLRISECTRLDFLSDYLPPDLDDHVLAALRYVHENDVGLASFITAPEGAVR
jgi:hypothetical protein